MNAALGFVGDRGHSGPLAMGQDVFSVSGYVVSCRAPRRNFPDDRSPSVVGFRAVPVFDRFATSWKRWKGVEAAAPRVGNGSMTSPQHPHG